MAVKKFKILHDIYRSTLTLFGKATVTLPNIVMLHNVLQPFITGKILNCLTAIIVAL
jgi:hypothetical protein